MWELIKTKHKKFNHDGWLFHGFHKILRHQFWACLKVSNYPSWYGCGVWTKQNTFLFLATFNTQTSDSIKYQELYQSIAILHTIWELHLYWLKAYPNLLNCNFTSIYRSDELGYWRCFNDHLYLENWHHQTNGNAVYRS